MTFTLMLLEDDDVLLFSADPEFDISEDVFAVIEEAKKLLDSLTDPVTIVNDFRTVPPPDMDDLMVGATAVARGDSPLYHHPMLRSVVFVTTDETFRTALRGLSGAIYGEITAHYFDTLEEALAFARG